MRSIETLKREHRTIERLLDAMEAWARPGAPRGWEELAELVAWVQRFVDPVHHGKEEDILFATLVEHGFPRQHGPIAVMLHEHDEARALIGRMADRTRPDGPWGEQAQADAAQAAMQYVALMRLHIHKEDGILYPMAQARLPADAQASVDARCEAFDAQVDRELVNRLHAEFGTEG